MALIVIPSLLSKRPWARIRARCEASFFIVLSKSSRCCSVRGDTYLTIIHLGIGFTYRIVLKLSREYYTKKLLVGHLLRLRRSMKAVLLCQPQATKTCCTASSVPKTTRWRTRTKRRRRTVLITCA